MSSTLGPADKKLKGVGASGERRASALRRLVEEFVTRDTTDYGRREKSLEEKGADVMHQLERGEATIVFDTEARTTHIVAVR